MPRAKKAEPIQTLHVRIVMSNGTCWYRGEIGKVFEVEPLTIDTIKPYESNISPRYYLSGQEKKNGKVLSFILKKDCEVVEK